MLAIGLAFSTTRLSFASAGNHECLDPHSKRN